MSVNHGKLEKGDLVHIFQIDYRAAADHGKKAGFTHPDITDVELCGASCGIIDVKSKSGAEVQHGGNAFSGFPGCQMNTDKTVVRISAVSYTHLPVSGGPMATEASLDIR